MVGMDENGIACQHQRVDAAMPLLLPESRLAATMNVPLIPEVETRDRGASFPVGMDPLKPGMGQRVPAAVFSHSPGMFL